MTHSQQRQHVTLLHTCTSCYSTLELTTAHQLRETELRPTSPLFIVPGHASAPVRAYVIQRTDRRCSQRNHLSARSARTKHTGPQ